MEPGSRELVSMAMADDQPPPEATTAPPPTPAPLPPPPFLSFLPYSQQIPAPFWQQIPLPFPIVNLQPQPQPHPHPQTNHGGVSYVAMPMVDAQRGVVASRSASVPAGIVQARKLLPPSSAAQPGGGHVPVPSQASVAGMQLFAESPESTLLDPQTSPPPPTSGLHTSNLRPRPPQAETHVASMQAAHHQHVYPPPLAAHQDVVADRRLFFSTLTKFHAFFETQLVIPKIEGDELDLHLLYCLVTASGGLEQVIKLKKWNHIIAAFSLPTRVLSQPYFFRKHYSNLLHHYEQVYFFRCEGELVRPPVPLPSPNLLSPSQFHNQPSFPVGEKLEPVKKRRRKRVDRVEMLEADAGKLVGRVVTGFIDGKFEHGYLVTVHVGTEKLRGILYNVPIISNTQQFATVPVLRNNVGVPASSSSFQVALPRKRRGRVSKRDPNAPRLNRSGYNFFFAEQRSRLKHLGSENAEITRIIGDMWQRLTEQERMPYLLRGQSDKERYRKEKKDYHERGKMQLQQRQGAGISRGFLESVHDIERTPQELEEAEQDSGDVNDMRHDYHVSLDADLDGGEMNLSQENNLQNQIYSLYVAGDHLNYGQEHLHYISSNTNPGQEPLNSEQTAPLQDDGHNAATHMDDLQNHSQYTSENIVGSQDDE